MRIPDPQGGGMPARVERFPQLLRIIFALTSMVVLTATRADAQPNAPRDTWTGFVGFGALAVPEYEGADDLQAVPLLAARAQYNQYYVQTRGLGLRANVSPSRRVEFGPAVQFRFGRDDDVENEAIGRLREVDDALEAGLFIRLPFRGLRSRADELALEADVLTDVTDTHEGTLVSLGLAYSTPVGRKWRVSASVSANYATDDFNETYYSIDADNAARSGLRRFEAEGGFNGAGLTFTVNYSRNERWGAVGLAGYRHFLGDAADSPIIDQGNESQLIGGLGLTYRF